MKSMTAGGSAGGNTRSGGPKFSGNKGGSSRGGFTGPRRSFGGGGNSGGRGGSGGGSRGGFRSGGNKRGKSREQALDESLFVQKATKASIEKNAFTPKHSFADFPVTKQLITNIAKKGYTNPTPIQDETIPAGLEGKDIVGLANTGSGKTSAFLIPIINSLYLNSDKKALVIAPTRELAQQIYMEFRDLSNFMRIFGAVCVGGMSIYNQISQIERGAQIIIGTPGRLQDLEKRGVLNFSEYSTIVVDEMDHMLDLGFLDVITEILSGTPKDRQSLFFSATMPPRIKAIVDRFVKNPKIVELQSNAPTHNVDQDIVRFGQASDKMGILGNLLKESDKERVLVFAETKREVDMLTSSLMRDGHKVDSIHGDKRQRERERSLKKFKDGVISVLVATDVAARGIDVNNVSHVINYTIPQTREDYIHRIGRTGRGGKPGKALTFVQSR